MIISGRLKPAIAGMSLSMLAAAPAHAAMPVIDSLFGSQATPALVAINLFLTAYFAVDGHDHPASPRGPDLLARTGIFGGFAGIALALLYFDPGRPAASAPVLLDGVRTALWAMATGIGGAYLLRRRHSRRRSTAQPSDAAPRASGADVATQLAELHRRLDAQDAAFRSEMDTLRRERIDDRRSPADGAGSPAETPIGAPQAMGSSTMDRPLESSAHKLGGSFDRGSGRVETVAGTISAWEDDCARELAELEKIQRDIASALRGATDRSATGAAAMEPAEVAGRVDDIRAALHEQQALIQTRERAFDALLKDMNGPTPQVASQVPAMFAALKAGIARLQQQASTIAMELGVHAQRGEPG